MHPKASVPAVKSTHDSDSLSAGFQGYLIHMFITKNSAEAANVDTSELIKKALVSAVGQHQGYDILHHSIRTHREQLGFRDIADFSVGISLQ